jgi:RNA polymerase sigma-70 factor, ECF subfamily
MDDTHPHAWSLRSAPIAARITVPAGRLATLAPPDDLTVDDAALVIRAQAGEARAKELLFRRHARRVHGLAYRLLAHDRDLEEVVQDVFVEALAGLGSLREPSAFGSWLGAIVVHRVRRRIRRRRLAAALGLVPVETVDVDELPGDPSSEAALELRRVHAHIAQLDAEERIALVLHRVEGYSLPELAERMGLSLATVKRRLASAEQKLAHEMGGDA